VQIPDGDFKSQINTLSQQPGMGYLNELAARSDVNWQPVKLAHESWNYQHQGLTGIKPTVLLTAHQKCRVVAGTFAPSSGF
jgi:hypothetical protein